MVSFRLKNKTSLKESVYRNFFSYLLKTESFMDRSANIPVHQRIKVFLYKSKTFSLNEYVFLFLILIAGLWPLFAMKASLKWDALDLYLPWKNFACECLNNGILPFWTPFINGGFPQMGDPGTWYPVSWLIGLVSKYNIYSLHFEFLLHLYIAAIGAYKLSHFLGLPKKVSLFIAISYMFSGFFVSNAQHIGWLVGAAWLPFMIYFLLKTISVPSYLNAALLALVCYFSLSGGYPGVFIISAYIVLFLVIFHLVKFLKEKDFNQIKRVLFYLFISGFLFLLLSSVVLASSFELANFLPRKSGLNFDNNAWGILNGSLHPVDLLTFITPFGASVNDKNFWIEDFSLINIYIGIIPIILLFTVLFTRKDFIRSKLFFFTAVIILMICMATIFPLRKWLYLYLPFMNLFRFPTIFRILSIGILLLAAGFAAYKISLNYLLQRKFMRVLVLVFILLLIFTGFAFFKANLHELVHGLHVSVSGYLKSAGVWEKILMQLAFQLTLLLLLYIILQKKILRFLTAILLIATVDMTVAIRLNAPATIVSDIAPVNYPTFHRLSDDYPIPDLSINMIETRDEILRKDFKPLWLNIATYLKEPSCDGNSPYSLLTTRKAIEDHYFYETMKNPLLFLASEISSDEIIDTNSIDHHSAKKITIISFNPNKIKLKVNNTQSNHLVYLQNFYKHWQAFIDKKAVPIQLVNETFMSISLPEGSHEIIFKFNPVRIRFLFYVSLSVTFLILCYLLVNEIVKLKRQKKFAELAALILFPVLLLSLILINLESRNTSSKMYTGLNKELRTIYYNTPLHYLTPVLNIDNSLNVDSGIWKTNEKLVRITGPENISDFIKQIKSIHDSSVFYAHINTYPVAEIKYLLEDKFGRPVIDKEYNNAAYYLFQKSDNAYNKPGRFDFLNDFEKQHNYWDYNPKLEVTDTVWRGIYAEKLNSINSFSSTFRYTMKKSKHLKKCLVLISLKAKFGDALHPLLVYEVYRKNQRITWEALDMDLYNDRTGGWQDIYYLQNKSHQLKKGDKIAIYVWNNTGKKIWIDNFRVRFFNEN